MEIKTKEQLEDEWGPAKALSPTEVINMFNWAKLKKVDVFYDLGSGHGRVVIGAIEHGKVKKAIGIEHEDDRFCKAREIAKRSLSKNKLKKIDFWLGDMEEFDISNATVVYEGHDPYEEDKMYTKLFKRKKGVKIIKRLHSLRLPAVTTTARRLRRRRARTHRGPQRQMHRRRRMLVSRPAAARSRPYWLAACFAAV